MGIGTVDGLPTSLLDRVRSLRARGWGPDRIYRELEKELSLTGVTPRTLSNWIYKRINNGIDATERLGKIAELLERSGISPEDIGKVSTVRLSEWQGLTKNTETGEAEIHDLAGASIVLTPHWAEGPQWPVVDRGPIVRLPRPLKPRTERDGWKTAVVFPDVQIGFRRDIETAQLDPFHDEQAIAAALRIARHVDPDLVVCLGDFLDLASFGRFDQEAGFALTVQPAIDRATVLLGEIRAAAPHAKVVLIEGNHDRRLQKHVTNNALAAFGLKRGLSVPEEWPVLSVPYLLRLEELDVTYVGGYPAGLYWINENLAAIHGHRVTNTGSTAATVVDDSRVSVIFGHTHRIELMHKTRRVYEGHKFAWAASPGCLCRIDGAVPSTKGSTDAFGRAVETVENWQHGCSVVTYEPGNGRFALELVAIYDGEVVFRGRMLAP